MEGDESGLTSYYHHHHPNSSSPAATNSNSTTNGAVFSDHHHHHLPTPPYSSEPSPIPYPPQSSAIVAALPPPTSAAPAPLAQETVKRKRGRPRKYGFGTANPDSSQVASPNHLSASSPLPSPPRKNESSSKKNQLFALGTAGQNFIPHIITVAIGEDVAQKILSFTQHHKRAVCILSASGSISNVSLRQPATLGGNVSYDGRFEILSLSGSYLHTETEGGSSRTGGLSVCLSNTDGRIIGGCVGGPLMAAGPVQVIIGSFIVDTNKEASIDSKFESSSGKLPQTIGSTGSGVSNYPSSDSHGRTIMKGNDRQTIGVNNFMSQFRAMQSMHQQPTDWRDSPGLTDQGGCQSSDEIEGEGDGDDGEF